MHKPSRFDLGAAVQAAVRFRQQSVIKSGARPDQAGKLIRGSIVANPTPIGSDGWWLVGHVRDMLNDLVLPVRFHPELDKVRLERPSAKSQSQPVVDPIRFTASVMIRDGKVKTKFRPYPSKGRPERDGPVLTLNIPEPEIDAEAWRWGMQIAEGRLNIIDMPDDFDALPPYDRWKLLVQLVHQLGLRIHANPDMRR